MSCNCTTPTYNCGNCGNTVPACTCSQTPILPPVYICPEPETCDEVFPLECVEYIGADIKCAAETDILHPAVEHYIVLEDGTRTDRRLPSILNNINSQLCYIFSKEYISQVLTIIQADTELATLFCEIACSCNCEITPPEPPRCGITCRTGNFAFVEGVWQFSFEPQADAPGILPITAYTLSWYYNDGNNYQNLGSNSIQANDFSSPIVQELVGAVDIAQEILVLIYTETDNSVCTSGLPPALKYTVEFIQQNETCDKFLNEPDVPQICATINITNITTY
jgi:hypothetical protein